MSERILLAGNGINDAQKISWNNLLCYVQNKLVKNGNFSEENEIDIKQSKISPTLVFEFLCKIDKNTSESAVRNIVKDYVEDKSNFVPKLWGIYDVILTTNFDNNLVISKSGTTENEKNPKEKKLTYEKKFLYRRLDFTYNKSDKKIFFIHGYYQKPETICLGFDQYTDNLKRIENFIVENYSINKPFKSSKRRKSISWIDYFFMDDTDIDVLGMNLTSDEIDLWWILNHRAKVFNKLKNNHIHYYDLANDKTCENIKRNYEKKMLLDSMKVEVIDIEDAEDYNSDFYSLCLKNIKEQEQKSIESKETSK